MDCACGAMPIPVSRTSNRIRPRPGHAALLREVANVHDDFAGFGELDGIPDQIQDDLSQTPGIADERGRARSGRCCTPVSDPSGGHGSRAR